MTRPFNFGLLTKAGAPTDGVDEVETLTIDAAGGTFTLTFGGQETDDIDFDATASAVQAALEALSSVGEGNITVSGVAGGPYTITFVGELGGLPQTDIVTDDTDLTGGAGTAVITQATAGVRGDYRGSPVGQLLIDSTNRIIYENSGSMSTPDWTEINVT